MIGFTAFVTSSDVEVLQAQVKAQWRGLDNSLADCVSNKKLDAADPMTGQWRAFTQTVSAFLQDSPSLLRAANQMNNGQALQRQLVDWTAKIEKLGCSVPPPPQPPAPGILDTLSEAVSKGATAVEHAQNLGGIATLALLWLLVSALKR